MPKVRTSAAGSFLQHYPKSATVVTVKAQDRENALAVAWHSCLSFEPPLYGVAISSKRYSYELILIAQEFAINFMPIESHRLIAALGHTSGRELDKFAKFHMAKEEPLKIRAPILRDAYAAYECKLVAHHPYGDHDWLVGEVVAVHYAQEAIGVNEILNLDRIKPAFYMGEDWYAELGKIALHHAGREVILD